MYPIFYLLKGDYINTLWPPNSFLFLVIEKRLNPTVDPKPYTPYNYNRRFPLLLPGRPAERHSSLLLRTSLWNARGFRVWGLGSIGFIGVIGVIGFIGF